MSKKAQIRVFGLKKDDNLVYLYPNPTENIENWRMVLEAEGYDEITVAIDLLDSESYMAEKDGCYPVRIYRDEEGVSNA